MDFGPAYISYLVEFYEAADIRAMWKQAGDALSSRATNNIHITATSYKSQSSTGITLANAAEIQAFMTACQSAIAQLEDTTTIDPARLGTGVDFSRSPVLV